MMRTGFVSLAALRPALGRIPTFEELLVKEYGAERVRVGSDGTWWVYHPTAGGDLRTLAVRGQEGTAELLGLAETIRQMKAETSERVRRSMRAAG